MKKLLFLLSVALSTLLLHAQTNQVVWLNGKVYYQQPVTAIDSITYDMNNMITGDTLQLILPRATQQIVYKEIHDTVYIYECPDYNVLAGAFSVSAEGKKVAFTRGNLQYRQSTATWSFAENQYDMLGTANVSGSALADKIDLFGWSGSTGSAQWGISTSKNNADYAGDFVDWGTNTIRTGTPNTYRTLTKDEWDYLINTRAKADSLKGIARINLNSDGTQYANGLIILPDDWTCPAGITFKSGFAGTNSDQAYADYQTFALAQWQQLENAGAVFLPASGYRSGSKMCDVQGIGGYWSATAFDNSNYAFNLSFYSHRASASWSYGDLYYGQAVRLVKDL